MGPGKGFVLWPHSRGEMSESVEAANTVRMQLHWNLQSSTTAAALALTESSVALKCPFFTYFLKLFGH